MAQNMSNFDAVLKDLYEGGIRYTLNSEVLAFKEFEKTSRQYDGGRVITYPVHVTRSPGVGARADGGALPAAGNQGHVQCKISATYQYGRIEVTGPTIAAGMHAFAEAMALEMEGMERDLKNDLGRQTWGTGDGRLAQIGAAGASASALSVYNRFFEPGQPGARFINAGMLIDAGTVAAPTAMFQSGTVVSVALSQNPATTTDTVTVSASSLSVSQCETYLFNRGAGGAGIELMGLQALVDVYTEANIWGSNAFFGATIQNISRATYKQWDANVLGNSGTARICDSNLMQVAFDTIHQGTGKDPDAIWGHHDVVRAFLDSVSADRRYATSEFNAGVSKLSYNGVPLVKDRQAPYNQLLVMLKETFKLCPLVDFEWADNDGAILSRVSGYDSWEAFMRWYGQLSIDMNPKGALFIRDIKTDL
jgi:hypothetical protein